MAQPSPEKPAAPAKKVVQIKRFQIGLNVIVQFIVLLCIIGMVNYVSFNHFKRWDFSRNQKYALSAQTLQVLKNLKKPVSAVVFFSSAQDIAGDVTNLLREYEYSS